MTTSLLLTCGFCLQSYEDWDDHAAHNHICREGQARNNAAQAAFFRCTEAELAGEPKHDAAQRAAEPGLRYDGGKSRIDLIDPGFVLHLGEHYAVGAKKYAERNWQKGMSYSRCYASAQRHMLAFWSGEDHDEETGSRHVIAAAWNMAAIDFYMSNPELAKKFDDRPKKVKIPN